MSFLSSSAKQAFFGGAQSGMYVAVLSAFDAALWDLPEKHWLTYLSIIRRKVS